jgi:hypothetical protein
VQSWARALEEKGALILTGAMAEIKASKGVSTAHKTP